MVRHTKERSARYALDQLYTREEAMEILGVSRGTIDRATSMDLFTIVREPSINPYRVFLLRSEVDRMVGYEEGPLTSKKAKVYMDEYRLQLMKSRLESEHGQQEASYGEPFPMAPKLPPVQRQESESMRAFRLLQEAFVRAFGSGDKNYAK